MATILRAPTLAARYDEIDRRISALEHTPYTSLTRLGRGAAGASAYTVTAAAPVNPVPGTSFSFTIAQPGRVLVVAEAVFYINSFTAPCTGFYFVLNDEVGENVSQGNANNANHALSRLEFSRVATFQYAAAGSHTVGLQIVVPQGMGGSVSVGIERAWTMVYNLGAS